jgi:hypothetical protein
MFVVPDPASLEIRELKLPVPSVLEKILEKGLSAIERSCLIHISSILSEPLLEWVAIPVR